MKNTLKSLLVAGSLALGNSCSSVDAKLGFNALYAGASSQSETGYARALNNVNAGNDTFRAHYHGLNEITSTDTNTYFGRNSFGVEPLNIDLQAIAEARGGSNGLFSGQPQYGIRDNHLPNMLGADWGFVQGTSNGSDYNLTLLYGKSLSCLSSSLSPLSIELFNSFDSKKDAKDSNLTELIVDWSLNKNLSLFVRQDTNDLEFGDSSYVIGGALKF